MPFARIELATMSEYEQPAHHPLTAKVDRRVAIVPVGPFLDFEIDPTLHAAMPDRAEQYHPGEEQPCLASRECLENSTGHC
jgi:hypothetical protein